MHACAAQDFGHSWVNLTANSGGAVASFWDFDWGASLHRGGGDRRSFPTRPSSRRVYESASAMKGPYPGWDKDIHFVASHDFFKSAHAKLVSCGNQFELIGRKVRKHRDLLAHTLSSKCSSIVQPISYDSHTGALMMDCDRWPCWAGAPRVAFQRPHAAMILIHGCMLRVQVFLALPSDCPTEPDGSPRTVESGAGTNAVILYTSDDEAQSFEQVLALLQRWRKLHGIHLRFAGAVAALPAHGKYPGCRACMVHPARLGLILPEYA